MKKAVALAAITIVSIAPLAACSSDDDGGGGDTPSGDTTLGSIEGETPSGSSGDTGVSTEDSGGGSSGGGSTSESTTTAG